MGEGAVEGEWLHWDHEVGGVVVTVPGGDVTAAKDCPLGADGAFVAGAGALPDVHRRDLLEIELIVLLTVLRRVLA